jgi:Holliday junction resolvasome RuvABC endonuclease subunit
MKILGIDIGTVNLGFCVLDNSYIVFSRTVKLDSSTSLGERLNHLDVLFSSYIKEHKVEGVIIEKPNIRQVDLYYVCGLFCYLSAKYSISFQEVNPSTVKKQIGGNGKVSKKELEEAVRYQVDNAPNKFTSDHESDSVAIALCWK